MFDQARLGSSPMEHCRPRWLAYCLKLAYGTRRCVSALWRPTVCGLLLMTQSEMFMFGCFVIGSVQEIACIPPCIKDIFKTAWEIKPENILLQAVDRAPYVCQSQSITLSIQDPTPGEIASVFKCIPEFMNSSTESIIQ